MRLALRHEMRRMPNTGQSSAAFSRSSNRSCRSSRGMPHGVTRAPRGFGLPRRAASRDWRGPLGWRCPASGGPLGSDGCVHGARPRAVVAGERNDAGPWAHRAHHARMGFWGTSPALGWCPGRVGVGGAPFGGNVGARTTSAALQPHPRHRAPARHRVRQEHPDAGDQDR